MNKSIKFLVYFVFMFVLSLHLHAQDMTELKVVNGIQESTKFQVVIAIAPSADDAPMVAKIVPLESFGDFDLFSIPRTEQIMIGVLPEGVELSELTAIPAEYMDKFVPISLESARSCDVIVKGDLIEGVNFTLANIEW